MMARGKARGKGRVKGKGKGNDDGKGKGKGKDRKDMGKDDGKGHGKGKGNNDDKGNGKGKKSDKGKVATNTWWNTPSYVYGCVSQDDIKLAQAAQATEVSWIEAGGDDDWGEGVWNDVAWGEGEGEGEEYEEGHVW